MTVWRHSISWSKFQMATKCQLQLKNTIEKVPVSVFSASYYRHLGIIVQFIFEQYFNQKINRDPRGREWSGMEKVMNRILNAKYIESLQVSYYPGQTEEHLRRHIKEQVQSGFKLMKSKGLLEKQITSEKKWNSVFRGLRIFCLIDFLFESRKGFYLFDGKGSKEEDANPDQLKYYAVGLGASGKQIAGGGFLYWQHGTFRSVDLSPAGLKSFIDEKITVAKPVFDKLRSGTEDLPPNPSSENCKWCNWRNNCPYSHFKVERVDTRGPEEVDL